MNVDDNIMEWAFKCIVGGILAVGAWLWKGLVNDVRSLEKDQSAFKLEVEKTFAKEVNVQATMARVHDRLDDISDDIKSLIRAVAEK